MLKGTDSLGFGMLMCRKARMSPLEELAENSQQVLGRPLHRRRARPIGPQHVTGRVEDAAQRGKSLSQRPGIRPPRNHDPPSPDRRWYTTHSSGRPPHRTADHAARYAIDAIRSGVAKPHHRTRFDTAVQALAAKFSTATSLTDYGRRRETLRTWSIPPSQWQQLVSDLTDKHINPNAKEHTDWGNGKRILASVWIWEHVTQGEHIDAPLIRDPGKRRPGGPLTHYVNNRWRLIDAPRPEGHYFNLRRGLEAIATKLTTQIDQ